MGELKSVPTLDGAARMPAYVAQPDGAPNAAIVLLPEIFGINAGIRVRADQLAKSGYVVVALDIFWRVAPGEERDPDVPEEFKAAIGDMQQYDLTTGLSDIEATIRYARDAAGGRKVGVTGYCFGGRLTYLAATRTDADACVGYYGGGIDAALGEAHAIANPLLLHFAGEDKFIPADALAKIHAALDANPHVTIAEYAGVDHGFATSFGSRRNETAATLADSRTAEFFQTHLS